MLATRQSKHMKVTGKLRNIQSRNKTEPPTCVGIGNAQLINSGTSTTEHDSSYLAKQNSFSTTIIFQLFYSASRNIIEPESFSDSSYLLNGLYNNMVLNEWVAEA